MHKFAVLAVLLLLSSATAQPNQSKETNMEKVTGIGGFFFRSKDPGGLAKWYHQHLGVLPVPTGYGEECWNQTAGKTVFAPFPSASAMLAGSQGWMINFRVDNLDKMVAQLQEAGIKVEVDPETYPNGRFAQLADPEGNPIQLWEPQDNEVSP